MTKSNPINTKFMNVGGDEYKREYGTWFSKKLVTHKGTAFTKWLKCSNNDAGFLSWCSANVV